MTKQKRDNAYYLEQVKRHHPAVYAQFLAGHFKSASAAILAAGVRQPPKPIHALMRAWNKASAADKAAFLSAIATSSSTGSFSPLSATSTPPMLPVVDADFRLTPHGRKRVQKIMHDRAISMGAVMAELGFKRLDASLGRALYHSHRLKPGLAAALQAWADSHLTFAPVEPDQKVLSAGRGDWQLTATQINKVWPEP